MRKNFLCLLLIFSSIANAQEKYAVSKIVKSLLENADAVVRNNEFTVEIEDIDKVVEYETRVLTILNKEGEQFADTYEYYFEGDKINEQELIILDAKGQEVKKYKKRDFEDLSAYGSSTLFSDSRVSYVDHTPRAYPYTIIYTSETESENSIFIRSWSPVEGYNISVENSTYNFRNPQKYEVRFNEKNLDSLNINIENDGYNISYNVKNLPAYESEILSPSFQSFAPKVEFALENFQLEGVMGNSRNWNEFGKWMYDNLVADHDQLPQSTVQHISELTKNASGLEEKARLIYKYVQDNTRYISVQYGIGGWEPATAREVDRLGYGDCKALTNYTKALLKTQGIEAYYTVVYGGEKVDINPDFTRIQGNHVILNIPQRDTADIWLECTSQEVPFNYIGDFTDDRYALRIKPEGGEIIKTRKYSRENNLEKINCEIQLDKNGGFNADFHRTTSGIPYGDIYSIQRKSNKEQKKYYRNEWSKFQNLEFDTITFNDDRNKIEFIENLRFKGDRLATKAGNRLLIPLNFIQQGNVSLEKYGNRCRPLVLQRGKIYKDEFIFKLPKGYVLESLPENHEVSEEFGEFSIEIESNEENGEKFIKVNRSLILNDGQWPAAKYQNFRNFIYNINTHNNLKAVLVDASKT